MLPQDLNDDSRVTEIAPYEVAGDRHTSHRQSNCVRCTNHEASWFPDAGNDDMVSFPRR